MTSESVAPKRFYSASLVSVRSRDSSDSVFSSTDESKDLPRRCMLEMQAPSTAMAESSESGRLRPKFRRPSTSTDEDISTWEHQLLAAFGDKTRRPSESSMESQYSRELSEIAEAALLDAAGQLECLDGLDEITNLVDTLCPKSFSYQPQRRRKEDHLQVSDDPALDKDSKNEMNDSNAHKNDGVCKDDKQEVPSFATSHTLLVEWGECDSTSTDEDCFGDETLFDDSDRAVINRGNLNCNSHEEEDRTKAAGSAEEPKSRRGLMSVFSSFSSEKGRNNR